VVVLPVLVSVKSGAVMVSLRAADVLAALFASPLYAAVSECAPTASVENVNVTGWEPFTAAVPIDVSPSFKLSVPVGGFVPVVVTAAVKVTATP
jgi:hypothetical protein